MTQNNVYLASKPRYEILDGLRGVAALMVIVFHCFETYIPFIGTQIVNHGYLAVDFFFVLSGFVMGLFMIPCGPKLDIRGWGEMNSFNGPNWSLTFEYVGNILYALIFRRLPKLALALLCLCAAFFTLDLTLGWDVFGLFAEPKYSVIGGWSLTADQVYIGFSRLLYPFLCGLLISRILPSRRTDANPSGSPIRLKGDFWWCSLALVVIFAIPQIGGKAGVPDGLYQAVSILLLFPLIVLAGAGSRTTDARSTRICNFLGNLSYPLYITHYPVMYMQMAWVERNPDAPLWMHIVLNVGVVLVSVGAAWAWLKLYDEPVRRWLTDRWLKRARK